MFIEQGKKPLAMMIGSVIMVSAVAGLTASVAQAKQCHPTELQGKVKWQPGHYLRIKAATYKTKSLGNIEKFLSNPNTKGLVLEIGWREIEKQKDQYDFTIIDEVKALVEAKGKKLSIKLNERCFGGCEPKQAGPDYLMDAGGIVGLYRHPNGQNGLKPILKGGIVRIWEKEFADRFIALYENLGQQYDLDDTIVGITIGAGESALAVIKNDQVRIDNNIQDIPSGYTVDKHINQLRRITAAAKAKFKHTIAYTGINFMPGGAVNVTKLLNNAKEIGGGGVVHPDTIPPGFGQNFYHYDVEKNFINDIAIFPQFQTPLVPVNLSETEMYEFARDELQANAIGWNDSFFNGNTKEMRTNYVSDYILPEVNKNNGRLNNKCPSSFANGCITIEKCTGQKGEDPNPVILPKLSSFSLINATNDTTIGALNDGDTINLATLPSRELNITANVDTNPVGSVSLVLAGTENQATTENVAPYSLFGDANGDYLVWKPALGSYTLSATPYADKNEAGETGNTLSVNFTVIDQPVSTTFKQGAGSWGIVNIPANKAHNKTTASGHRWEELLSALVGGVNGVMKALPDDGARINNDYVINSPRLDYKVNFVKTGTHYVWVRGSATGNDNTIHVGLNGKAVATADRIVIGNNQGFVWSRATLDGVDATLDIPATGVSTVNVWMREDGFQLHKILLTINPDYDPNVQ